jgi:hypothetical protein
LREAVPFQDIATAIGLGLGVPVASQEPGEAAAHFGWIAHFVGRDMPTSSSRTRARLGWTPAAPGLLADLARPGYFA